MSSTPTITKPSTPGGPGVASNPQEQGFDFNTFASWPGSARTAYVMKEFGNAMAQGYQLPWAPFSSLSSQDKAMLAQVQNGKQSQPQPQRSRQSIVQNPPTDNIEHLYNELQLRRWAQFFGTDEIAKLSPQQRNKIANLFNTYHTQKQVAYEKWQKAQSDPSTFFGLFGPHVIEQQATDAGTRILQTMKGIGQLIVAGGNTLGGHPRPQDIQRLTNAVDLPKQITSTISQVSTDVKAGKPGAVIGDLAPFLVTPFTGGEDISSEDITPATRADLPETSKLVKGSIAYTNAKFLEHVIKPIVDRVNAWSRTQLKDYVTTMESPEFRDEQASIRALSTMKRNGIDISKVEDPVLRDAVMHASKDSGLLDDLMTDVRNGVGRGRSALSGEERTAWNLLETNVSENSVTDFTNTQEEVTKYLNKGDHPGERNYRAWLDSPIRKKLLQFENDLKDSNGKLHTDNGLPLLHWINRTINNDKSTFHILNPIKEAMIDDIKKSNPPEIGKLLDLANKSTVDRIQPFKSGLLRIIARGGAKSSLQLAQSVLSDSSPASAAELMSFLHDDPKALDAFRKATFHYYISDPNDPVAVMDALDRNKSKLQVIFGQGGFNSLRQGLEEKALGTDNLYYHQIAKAQDVGSSGASLAKTIDEVPFNSSIARSVYDSIINQSLEPEAVLKTATQDMMYRIINKSIVGGQYFGDGSALINPVEFGKNLQAALPQLKIFLEARDPEEYTRLSNLAGQFRKARIASELIKGYVSGSSGGGSYLSSQVFRGLPDMVMGHSDYPIRSYIAIYKLFPQILSYALDQDGSSGIAKLLRAGSRQLPKAFTGALINAGFNEQNIQNALHQSQSQPQ